VLKPTIAPSEKRSGVGFDAWIPDTFCRPVGETLVLAVRVLGARFLRVQAARSTKAKPKGDKKQARSSLVADEHVPTVAGISPSDMPRHAVSAGMLQSEVSRVRILRTRSIAHSTSHTLRHKTIASVQLASCARARQPKLIDPCPRALQSGATAGKPAQRPTVEVLVCGVPADQQKPYFTNPSNKSGFNAIWENEEFVQEVRVSYVIESSVRWLSAA
jgi:hypothetical protein